jgi:lysozyme
VNVTQNQYDAMVSLAFNIGITAFGRSSVLRQVNVRNWQAAAKAFALWNKSTVRGRLVVLAGLTARRAAEAALYLLPDSDETSAPAEAMPQAVVGESPLAGSPIATSGAVTAGAGALGLLAQVPDQLGPVQSAVAAVKSLLGDTLGIPPSTAMALVLVAAGAAVVWWRWQQRRQGWA